MLILALASLPYGYYTLLRIVVCLCAFLIAHGSYSKERGSIWAPVFVGVGLLFNPIIPVHLSRSIWATIDIACAAIFFSHFLYLQFRSNTSRCLQEEKLPKKT